LTPSPLTLRGIYGVLYVEDGELEISHSESKIRKQEPVKCTECESQAIEYDDIRSEHVCLDCGLVLSGPPAYVAGLFMIDYPWGNNYLSEFEMETINGEHVIAWYGP